MSRSCESLKINSCNELKDSAYCLCDSDLCNHKPINRPTPPPSVGDDEDYVETEGSGHGPDSIDRSLDERFSSEPGTVTHSTSSEPSLEAVEDPFNNRDFTLDTENTVSDSTSLFNYNIYYLVMLDVSLLLTFRVIGK